MGEYPKVSKNSKYFWIFSSYDGGISKNIHIFCLLGQVAVAGYGKGLGTGRGGDRGRGAITAWPPPLAAAAAAAAQVCGSVAVSNFGLFGRFGSFERFGTFRVFSDVFVHLLTFGMFFDFLKVFTVERKLKLKKEARVLHLPTT